MVAAERSSESRLLIVLLAFVALFAFWVIPASVEDPEDFGYADGLAPSFSVYLVAALAAVTLFGRLVRVLMAGGEAVQSGTAPQMTDPQSDDASHDGNPEFVEEAPAPQTRTGTIIGACLIFPFLLIPYLGFYVSSFVFVIFLATIMGERRPMVLTFLPILLIAGIYSGFELGFTIFLPRGELVLQLVDIFSD